MVDAANKPMMFRIAPAGFVKAMAEATHFIPLTPPRSSEQ